MDMTAEDVRVLGSLIEKELTTPEQYPLTTNSLRLACNQKTNRDPVVELSEVQVDQAMLRLRQGGLARTVTGQGMRASKHKQVMGEAMGLNPKAVALLGVLMLRGAQTVGELRIRSDRAVAFESLTEVEAELSALATRHPEPLVIRLERRPGQKEERWAHLLCGDDLDAAMRLPGAVSAAEGSAAGGSPGAAGSSASRSATALLEARVVELETKLAALQQAFTDLCGQLGVPDLTQPDQTQEDLQLQR
ncbi:MAG: YceH family protein [Acidimicrobiales bacterium]